MKSEKKRISTMKIFGLLSYHKNWESYGTNGVVEDFSVFDIKADWKDDIRLVTETKLDKIKES